MSATNEQCSARDQAGSGTGARSELPQFLRDLLSSPPPAGAGIHQWLFRVARQLHAHRSAEEMRELLAAAVADCGRDVEAEEISDAVENSRECAWRPSGGTRAVRVAKKPKWPARDDAWMRKIAEADPGALEKLRSSSPLKINPKVHDADCVLDRLFPGDPLLCVAANGPKSVEVKRRSALAGRAGDYSLIVPSPMTATSGTNKKGRKSTRCVDNTGPRCYVITEFDAGTRDLQAAVLRYLSDFAPLVMVVDSGGKSLHGWWYCRGESEAMVERFFRMAVKLGADKAMWSRCQPARMPLGWRQEKNKRQDVPYFAYMNTAARKGGGL